MRKLYKKYLVILVLFMSFYSYADQVNAKPAAPAKLPSFLEPVDQPLSFTGKSIFYHQSMEQRSLESFDNRFIIVHFWATWCMECTNEIISLNNLQKNFRKKPLLVLAISEDFKDVAAIDKFFTKYKIDYLDIYLDKKNKIYQSLEINHLPASYLVDFNGNIIARSKIGIPINWEDAELQKYLEEKLALHQLLPPEYKKTRDKYEPPKEPKKEEVKNKPTKKSKLFIN